ncbi:unnamed protein product, partial [Pylaiella littoralis]
VGKEDELAAAGAAGNALNWGRTQSSEHPQRRRQEGRTRGNWLMFEARARARSWEQDAENDVCQKV